MVRFNLFTKITVLALFVITVSFSALGVSLYFTQKSGIMEGADERMKSQLTDLENLLSVMITERQKKINSSIKVANRVFNNKGEFVENELISVPAVNQITKEKTTVSINNWSINGTSVYNNFEIVDEIQSLINETVTIFQKIPQGYLRISTNVRKLDGSRAVGTFIPNSSPVIKAIEQGHTFKGRAYVVNDWYLTAYEPIYVDGEIKGILYVGVKEKNYSLLNQIFSDKSYFKTGYPFMVGEDGVFLIHPSLTGEDASDKQFFKQLKNSDGYGKSRYQWPESSDGEWKWQYFSYFEPYQSYVCVSIYEDDLLESLVVLRRLLIGAIFLAVLLAFGGFSLMLKPLIVAVKNGIDKAKAIAEGDLNQEFELSRKDEVGDLFRALKQMTVNIRTVINTIKTNADKVDIASEHIQQGSVQLSHSSSEQASVSEEVASSIVEIEANLNQASINADNTQKISIATFQSVKEGAESSDHSLLAMRKIAEKIRVIDDISFQTNILALNASVEAARAGTFGAGFSVVASEVSKLAEQSKEAASEINTLTESGVAISEKAGLQLSKNVPETERTASLIKDIAQSTHEQSLGVSQVNSAIQELNLSIQQNAATSEELSSNADSLKQLSNNLKSSISYFKM